MNPTNSQDQTDNLGLGVDIAPDSGLANVTNVLALLLERAEENLTPQELNWLADGIDDTVQCELDNLHSVVNGIAGLVSCDKRAGNFRDTESVSSLMWSIAHQIDVIRGLSELISRGFCVSIRNQQGDYTAFHGAIHAPRQRKSHMNKKQQKRLTAPMSRNQFIRELDKLKLSRNAKTALFKARKAEGMR